MNYVGVDLHKERSWFYVTNEQGKRIDSQSIANLPEVLRSYYKRFHDHLHLQLKRLTIGTISLISPKNMLTRCILRIRTS